MTLPHLLLLLAPLGGPPPQSPWPPLAEADWAAWQYQMIDEPVQGDYLLVGEVRATGGRPGRVAFNMADERNYYALELASGPPRLLRVESGLEQPIGASLGATPSLRKWTELVIRCEDGRIDAFVAGERVAGASDTTFAAGRTAYSSGGAQFRDLRVQETAPIYLDDDFMRAEGETGGWEIVSGNWRVQSVGSPVRSTNAFNFTVDKVPKGAAALCGNWFWHDYEVAVSCQPHGPAQAGLYACYQDSKDYLRFACGQAGSGSESTAELIAVSGGRRRSLAREPLTLTPGQWYRLALRVEGARVTGLVDGHPVVTARTEERLGGQAGLHAATTEGITFDDFCVRQSPVLPWEGPHLELWQPVGDGLWSEVGLDAKGEPGRIQASAAATSKLLLRQSVSGDVCVRTEVTPPSDGAVGLVAGWEDEGNYHALLCGGTPAMARLVTVADGQTTVQDEAPLPAGNARLPMELSLVGPALRAQVGDGLALTAENGLLPRGRVGLLIEGGTAEFASPVVERAAPLPEVPRFEGAFSEEVSMADWAAQNADWVTVKQEDGAGIPSCWHKAPGYGDQEISLRLAGPPLPQVTTYLASPEIGARTESYAFTVRPGSDGSATLLRAGQPAAAQPLADVPAESIREIGLSRSGPLLIGRLNRRPVLFFRDPEPLTGLFAGWTAPEGVATPADATFRAENVLSYSFREAPSDWWVGSGDWRITNRWDCEPRWTFFIGGGEGVASLWNKHEFGDDLTLDFYSAIRFDSTQGYEYRYASDINCTLAADGRDLSSGYSFMFGGWDNQYTRLMRGNEVAVESTAPLIPRSSSIHRQWFNLRVRKTGGRIQCWLDGRTVFDYTDPEPLPGHRVALWTYNNAIAVARVRIASNEVHPGPLAAPEGPPRCPYDQAAP